MATKWFSAHPKQLQNEKEPMESSDYRVNFALRAFFPQLMESERKMRSTPGHNHSTPMTDIHAMGTSQ